MYPWLRLGPYALSTYSLLFLGAYVAGGMIAYSEARRLRRNSEAILLVAIGGLAGGTIGAKLSMLIFLGPSEWLKDVPYLWYSGQSWTGGFVGGYAGVMVVKRWLGIGYATGDIFAPALPLAQAIGRLGNLLGGDPFGLPSSLPWAIVQRGVRRQPSALYELILDIALFVLIWNMRDRLPQAGDLFRLYVVAYAGLRFAVDFTRADPRVALDLTLVQLLYAPAAVYFGYRLCASLRAYRRAGAIPVAQSMEMA